VSEDHKSDVSILADTLKVSGHLGSGVRVYRGERFIQNETFWIVGHGHGQKNLLLFAAAELVGIMGKTTGWQSHFAENFLGPLSGSPSIPKAMLDHRFHDLVDDPVHWIEYILDILKNHRNSVPADLAHGFITELEQIDPLEKNLSPYRSLAKSHEDPAQRGFPGPGLSDQSERIASLQFQIDSIQDSVEAIVHG
jgi:hypothetical protein